MTKAWQTAKDWHWLVLLCVLTAAAYWQGLGGPLLLDDFANLEPVRDYIAGEQSFRHAVFSNESGTFGRSLSMFTLAINAWLTGADTWWLKATNLGIHIACGILCFFIGRRTFLLSGAAPATAGRIALAVAGWWLLSPAFASTVLYVIQRMAQLSTLTLLAGLAMFLVLRPKVTGPRTGLGLLAAVAGMTVVSVLAKENGIILPALCCAAEYFLFRGPHQAWAPFRARAWRALLVAGMLSPLLVIVAYFLLRPESIAASLAIRDFTIGERLLSQLRAVASYQVHLLVPYSGGIGLYHDDFKASTGLLSPPTTLLSGLALAAGIALGRFVRPRYRNAFGFGVALFLIGHVIESTAFPLELYFDHRNYFPGIGTLIAVASLIASVAEARPRIAGILRVGIPCLLLASGIATSALAHVWSHTGLIHLRALQEHPRSARAHLNVASLHAAIGDYDRAKSFLESALRLAPDERAGIGITWALIECDRGLPISDWPLELVASDANPAFTVLYVGALKALVARFSEGKCRPADAARVVAALEQYAENAPGKLDDRRSFFYWYHLAQLQQQAGDLDAAIASALRAGQARPERAEPWFAAAMYLGSRGEFERAKRYADMAAEKADPTDAKEARRIAELRAKLAEDLARTGRSGAGSAARSADQPVRR